MGLLFLGVGSQREVKIAWRPRAGLVGAPLLGAVFALGWAPCTGRPSPRSSSWRRRPRTPRWAAAWRSRRRTASVWACRSSSSPPGWTEPVGRPGGCAAPAHHPGGGWGHARRRGPAPGHRRVGGAQPLAAGRARRAASRWPCEHPHRRPARRGPAPPRRVGWLRWTWRQLTSMRTALFLLLLLAIGAIPGSTFPQRSIDPARTAQWIADHPTAGPVLDRLGFFEVYASPWFAAIYLLLFVSLIGCVLPRTRILWHQVRSAPPRAPPPRPPRRPPRGGRSTATRTRSASVLRGALRGRRYRVHAHDGRPSRPRRATCARPATSSSTSPSSVCSSASPGDTCSAGRATSSCPSARPSPTRSRYDTFSPGPWVDVNALSPFTLRLDGLDVEFETEVTGRGQFGAPRDFEATTTFTDAEGSTEEPVDPGQRPARDRRRLGLPPRQRLRPDGSPSATPRAPCSTPTRRRSSRRTTTTLGRRRSRCRVLAATARLRRVLPADRGHRRRAGAALGLPRRPRPPAGAHRLRRRPLPQRSAPVRLLPRHRGDDRDPGRGRRRPAADPPATRASRSSSPTAEARSPSTGSSASRGCRSAPTGQGPDPRGRPAVARRARRLARHPPSKGLRAGWAGDESRVVLWCPSAAWPRTTTTGCPTRSPPS